MLCAKLIQMENVSICCVGDSTIDRFFRLDNSEAELLCRHNECEIAFDYGGKILIDSYHRSFGGSALNTAVGFSRLGIRSGISTILGTDSDSNDTVKFLNENSVALVNVLREGETNQSTILIYKGERTIFSYHKDRDYSRLTVPKSSWIYLASAGKGFEEIIKKIEEAKRAGSKIAINPGSAQLHNFKSLSELVKGCEVLFLNKEEAEMLFEHKNIKTLLSKASLTGAKITVITDGANGAYITSGQDHLHMGIAPSTLVDQTGAGDAFACAFTAGLINKLSLEDSAKWGMVSAASVVGKIGANLGLLTKDQITLKAKEALILKADKINT